MGAFLVSLGVGDPQGERFETVGALVDTGATYTTLPASTLRKLGVSPHTRGLFRLTDGSRIELDIGQTWVRLEGRGAIVPVIFGDHLSI